MNLWNIFEWKSKKQQRRDTLAQNQAKGKAAEGQFVFLQRLWGNNVVRTGRGSDFRVTEHSIWTGKKKTYLVEVKSGKGKLSRLQKKTKKNNRNYRIKQVNLLLY